MSTFKKYHSKILELTKSKDNYFVYKPHPRLKFSLVEEERFFSNDEYNEYLNFWHNSVNTCIYESGDYFELFSSSDFLITDCSSFLIEYFLFDKPIIWLRSEFQKIEFNEMIIEVSECFYEVNSWEDLHKYYFDLSNGIDPKKELRHALYSKYKSIMCNSSEKIVNYLDSL